MTISAINDHNLGIMFWILIPAILIVVFDGIRRILGQFHKQTSKMLSIGVTVTVVGSVFFILRPDVCGAMIIIGRAMQLLSGDTKRRCCDGYFG